MEKWYIYNKKADFAAISNKYNITPMLARILRNREITEDRDIEEYLNGDLTFLHDPFKMKGLREACLLIWDFIRNNGKIRIMGDYDIDGICACHILKKYLKSIGADTDADIPDRVTDGYGLSCNMVEKAFKDGVKLILTCDNGISAYESIQRAKELGISVIVTDHHEIPSELPPADVIIDPHLEDDAYPYKDLCGAGVAFKLVCGLEKSINGNPADENRFVNPVIDELLLYAGFATVGDIVPLVGENRIIVKEGIKRLRKTTNIGLNALIDIKGIAKDSIDSYHIGFVLGPCINSAGRLKNAKIALELIESEDSEKASAYAKELNELNEIRKDMTEQQAELAAKIICEKFNNDRILVVELPKAHESITGIVAGRLKEEFNRPAIVLSNTETGIKGSGRSVENYNIINEISRFPEMFEKFGGHAKACGFTLKKGLAAYDLRKKLNDSCMSSIDDLKDKTWIDMQLPFEYATIGFAEEINLLAPFGAGNRQPVFAEKDIIVNRSCILGKEKNVLKLSLLNGNGTKMDGIVFGSQEKIKKISDELYNSAQEKQGGVKVMFTYIPKVNEFRGHKSVQAVIDSLIVQ